MTGIVIVGAARTPVGSFMGALSSVPAHELGAVAISAALQRSGIAPDAVDEVIEKVLADGGEVFFLESGTLDVHQKIAAVLRY